MTQKNPEPESVVGNVFVIPLLGGQFGFGYVTAVNDGIYLCNIFDVVSDDPNPGDAIRSAPVLIDGYLVGGLEFRKSKRLAPLQPWAFCGVRMDGEVRSANRYFREGIPPQRIDFMGVEKDVPLTKDEAASYRAIRIPFSPGATAEIEIALKRLNVESLDLMRQWGVGEIQQTPMRLPKKPAAKTPAKKTSGRAAKDEGQAFATVTIPLEQMAPSERELAVRHALEDEIMKSKVGEIVSAGAGMGEMDVQVRLGPKGSRKALEAVLAKLDLADRAKVTLSG